MIVKKDNDIIVLQAEEGMLLHRINWPDTLGVPEVYLGKMDSEEYYEDRPEESFMEQVSEDVVEINEIQEDLDGQE